MTHGLGLIGAAFGLAVSVGPVLGGSLTKDHAGTACWLSASMSVLGVLSLKFFGWEETAPAAAQGARGAAANASAGGWKKFCARGSPSRIVNPFSVLKVFLESRWDVFLLDGRVGIDAGCAYGSLTPPPPHRSPGKLTD